MRTAFKVKQETQSFICGRESGSSFKQKQEEGREKRKRSTTTKKNSCVNKMWLITANEKLKRCDTQEFSLSSWRFFSKMFVFQLKPQTWQLTKRWVFPSGTWAQIQVQLNPKSSPCDRCEHHPLEKERLPSGARSTVTKHDNGLLLWMWHHNKYNDVTVPLGAAWSVLNGTDLLINMKAGERLVKGFFLTLSPKCDQWTRKKVKGIFQNLWHRVSFDRPFSPHCMQYRVLLSHS